MLRNVIAIASLTFAACASSDDDEGPAVTDDAPQQLTANGVGKGDGTTTVSKDPRLVNCHLEYESFLPDWTARPAAQLEKTFGEIETSGVTADDGTYAVALYTNPNPPYNLSFIARITEVANSNKDVAYVVLPRPHVGGAFLFEIGADIPPATFPDTGTRTFPTVRAYCSIRMP
jgi:hypothetical protein